jgi:hypothetical protein
MEKIFISIFLFACEVLGYTSAACSDSDCASCTRECTCFSGNGVDDLAHCPVWCGF